MELFFKAVSLCESHLEQFREQITHRCSHREQAGELLIQPYVCSRLPMGRRWMGSGEGWSLRPELLVFHPALDPYEDPCCDRWVDDHNTMTKFESQCRTTGRHGCPPSAPRVGHFFIAPPIPSPQTSHLAFSYFIFSYPVCFPRLSLINIIPVLPAIMYF